MPAPGPSRCAELEPQSHAESVRHDALTTATALADALADPAVLASTPNGLELRRHGPGRPWPQALATGAAGIALLHIERARSGHGEWAIAHQWVQAACVDDLTAAANASLYMGVPAIAFMLNAAARPEPGYQHALQRLDEAVISLTRRRLDAAHTRINRGEYPHLKEFDLIRGLTGLGVYHLRRHPDHPITTQTLRYLARLTQPGDVPGPHPPWWTPVAPNGDHVPEYPHGHGNLGASHGISAPLALLSVAMLAGMPVPAGREAIERLCSWTDQLLQHDRTGPWWPGLLDHDQADAGSAASFPRPRPSWCYGVAGTARAQQLAALALGDVHRQSLAETAMATTLQDTTQIERITELGLCHGLAGLLRAAGRMASDERTSQITDQIPALTRRILLRNPNSRTAPIADPSLLDGAAGLALALHAVGTSTHPLTEWDAILAVA
ncbi:lanthionine synthetase C family protein [Actinomadura rudentiformis]|uniref:Lanthionine synthetase C family protein n=1 Tax=Actinomadura rudentiformis TaxID=359158 RepID=A0A6H9YXE3_9ACTN|nr:lanthionine synthetase C family protein [Actinomadura rudentiformis]KAB2344842.1 lanthionine synthetase C family protein [Actinomadura rudentiformis]